MAISPRSTRTPDGDAVIVTGFLLLSCVGEQQISTILGMLLSGWNLDLVAHYAVGCLQLSHS